MIVATAIEIILKATKSAEFYRWLRNTVGKLADEIKISRFEEIKAIGALGIPIATTNYDTILERGLGRDSVSWQDIEQAVSVLDGSSDYDILHLHGFWKRPQTVVLGAASYQRVADDFTSTAIKQAVSGSCSFLFIGCGADGLSDPDFAPFFQWTATAWRGAGRRHFRLCLKAEVAEEDQQIVDISYGERHDCLAGFLDSITPHTPVIS